MHKKTVGTEAIVLNLQQFKNQIDARRKYQVREDIEFIRVPKQFFAENWAWYCSHHEAGGNCHSEDEALFMGGAHLYYSPKEELCDLYLSDDLN